MSELETTRQKEFDLETVIKGSDQSHNLAVDTVTGGKGHILIKSVIVTQACQWLCWEYKPYSKHTKLLCSLHVL